MMVSKVAVIALVAIIAVPIMLGYAMNLDQVTETDYKTAGDSVNVTPLLQNGIEYTDVNANTYQINSNFTLTTMSGGTTPTKPIYTTNNVRSSIPLEQYVYSNDGGDLPPGSFPAAQFPLSGWRYMYLYSNINVGSTGYLNFAIYDQTNTTQLLYFNKIVSVDWNAETSLLSVLYYSTGASLLRYQITIDNPNDYYRFTSTGTYTADGYLSRLSYTNPPSTYANISAGYHFRTTAYNNPSVKLPDNTKSFIMTINLDSITDANYTKLIEIYPDAGAYVARLQFTKTTTGSDVSWQVATGFSLSTITDLYYDPNRNDNTYQLYCEISNKEITASGTSEKATINYSLKYIGGWSTTIGGANPYISYDFTSGVTSPISNNFYNGLAEISIGGHSSFAGGKTPTIRMDAAVIKGYELPIISDQVYDPKTFKDNPSTTIENVTKYGSSITFGGNTYTVTRGNITLGTHDIPVKGLVLSSVPVSGGYENKIGNTVISTTAQPSTITFNGNWSASISTTAQEQYEYTKTEWIAGGFAWDGIDQNFLMVGLITCLGVFIALGIYARRSGARVLPLMIVCGGAALLFFVML